MKSKKLYYIDRVSEMVLDTRSVNFKVDEIASSIGVTKKTLYNYFDSKQQLMECVVDSYLKRDIDAIRAEAATIGSPIASLVAVGRKVSALQHNLARHPAITRELVDAASVQRIVSERREELLALVVHFFMKGSHTGVFDDDLDAVLAGKLFLSGIEATAHRRFATADGRTADYELGKVMYYMLKGCCSSAGLLSLREALDLRVVAC